MPSRRAYRLLEALEARQEQVEALLCRLTEAESPSGDIASQRVPQELLAAELEALGLRIRRIPGRRSGGHLLAVPAGRRRGRPIQLLVGHSDTVWPLGTLATMPVAVEGDKLRGPGIFDMKGGLVLALAALRALREIGEELSVDPVVFINSDEEIGSPDSRRIVTRLARLADRVLVVEPGLGPEGKLKTARKGVGHFVLRVRGRAAHAGLDPGEGVSAILELSHLVQRLFELNDPESGVTVNVGTIDGGVRPNVVAAECRAEVDVRVLTREQGVEVERRIRALAPRNPDARLEIDGGVDTPPLERTPANRRLWRRALEAAAELGLAVEECLAGGASDGNTASLYAPTLDGLGVVGGGAHALHEFVYRDRLAERAALLALLLAQPVLGAAPSARGDRLSAADTVA